MNVLTLAAVAIMAHLRPNQGYSSDTEIVFPALNAINIMTVPIFMIGQQAANVLAFGALRRIEEYL